MPVQTRSQSSGQPNISLESKHGVPKISITDNFGKSVSTHKLNTGTDPTSDSVNLCDNSNPVDEEEIELYGDADGPTPHYPAVKQAPGIVHLIPATETSNEHKTCIAIVNAKATKYGFTHALYKSIVHQAFNTSTDLSGNSTTYKEATNGPKSHLWIP